MQFLFDNLIFDIPTVLQTKKLFWHNVTLFVFLSMPPKHYKMGENNETKKTWTNF